MWLRERLVASQARPGGGARRATLSQYEYIELDTVCMASGLENQSLEIKCLTPPSISVAFLSGISFYIFI